MIHVYRHSHAGTRKTWDSADEERPLSDKGWSQSALVASYLAGIGVDRILTSPYTRCVQSVEPLAAATGLTVEIEAALTEGTGPDRVDGLLAALEPGVVLCSHGDIISGLIGRLAADGADLDAGLVWQKGSVWHLEPGPSGRIRRGRYVPPPVTGS